MQITRHVTFWMMVSIIQISSMQQTVSGADRVRAFPGAEGFGAYAVGGRGGKILFVTNLQDYDPETQEPVAGSLRAAIAAPGPRTLIFRVSGTIALKRALIVREPYLTLAGQSAPGDGICIKNHDVYIRSHNVIVRHLRFRPGDEVGVALAKQGLSFQCDALSVESHSLQASETATEGARVCDIMIDHCSASWASDEVLSVSGPGISRVTVQWCLISESLTQSTHPKGKHGMGSLIRCDGDVSFHHNLYAHHNARLPRAGTYSDVNAQNSLLLDFRHNVIYGSGPGYTGEDPARLNYVGNYIKASREPEYIFSVGGHATWLYVADNYLDALQTSPPDQWALVNNKIEHNKRQKPFVVAPVTGHEPTELYEKVLASCGATRPKRDAVDTRLVAQVRSGRGQLINSQQEVGGWPTLRSAAAPQDKDHDGMPDEWELRYGCDPETADDALADPDQDGYTNIEEWLNETHPGQG